MMKEIIRTIYFGLCYIGFASPEVVCESGTLKFRFYNWLYGDGEPLFATQWPDEEE